MMGRGGYCFCCAHALNLPCCANSTPHPFLRIPPPPTHAHTTTRTPAPSGAPQDRGQLIVFDDVAFDRVAAYPLNAQELACSLTSVTFAGDDTPYYALGTAVVKPEEYEPSKGRLVLLAYR